MCSTGVFPSLLPKFIYGMAWEHAVGMCCLLLGKLKFYLIMTSLPPRFHLLETYAGHVKFSVLVVGKSTITLCEYTLWVHSAGWKR